MDARPCQRHFTRDRDLSTNALTLTEREPSGALVVEWRRFEQLGELARARSHEVFSLGRRICTHADSQSTEVAKQSQIQVRVVIWI